MHFRTILSGTLALLLVTGASAGASDGAGLFSDFKLPGVFSSKTRRDEAPVQLAQAGDPRITALEEQVRQLSGTIEELNFQILQMQEQLRKMQEDNEFRFQELEGKKTDAGGTAVPAQKGDRATAEAAPTAPAAPAPAENGATVGDIIVEDQTGEPGATTGEPPKTFGTITFDEKGNVTGGGIGDTVVAGTPPAPAQAEPAAPAGADDTVVAALPSTNDPEELYRNAYEFILSGDYKTAETGFRDHIARFPQDAKAADSHYWLGEAMLGQKKYRDAAEIFLAASKDYPSSKKAPDMLLKLGVSLVGLNQKDVACATFAEVGKRYPDANSALKDRIKNEQALAAC